MLGRDVKEALIGLVLALIIVGVVADGLRQILAAIAAWLAS